MFGRTKLIHYLLPYLCIMKTKKQKIEWLMTNTKNLNERQQLFWENYLNTRLIFTDFPHKEIDEFIDYCKKHNGECYLKQFSETLEEFM